LDLAKTWKLLVDPALDAQVRRKARELRDDPLVPEIEELWKSAVGDAAFEEPLELSDDLFGRPIASVSTGNGCKPLRFRHFM
jgi:hypothetical protein